MADKQGDYRLGYRPDVEGLRAVAILLVVAAHAGVGLLQGGFVGVDVFYILSGYLITGLLVQESATTGRLGFARFYARRLRRLLPALLLMLAVTCVVAHFFVPPTELPLQASTATGAAVWLSNFQFALWDWDYFAPSSSASLYLHTWSLGVEEQFYLVWPLLIVLTLGAWRRATGTRSTANLKWLFAGIFALSFALSLFWTYRTPMFAFYLMPARAWQFALGALVFLAVGSPAFDTQSRIRTHAWLRPAGWIGLAMILLGGWIIDPAAPYPGTWALLPSFGAALVLAAGAYTGASGIRTLLSWRPMQAIGRVSYSWYLWHWPVLLLGAIVLDMTNAWNRLLLVVLSLGIAALSYHYFETPIRHMRKLVAKPRLAIAAALAVMFVTVGVLQVWKIASQQRADSPQFASFVAAADDKAVIYANGCFGSYLSTEVQVCKLGDANAKHIAVVLGDSKAAQWLPALDKIFTARGWQVLAIAKSACPMVDATYIAAPLRRDYTECNKWRAATIRQVVALHPDVVVLSESVTYPFTRKQWEGGTRNVLRALAPHVGRIYLMRPTPELPFNARVCPEPRGRLFAAIVGTDRCTGPAYTPHFNDVGQSLRSAANSFPNVRVIDMTNSVCPGGLCHPILSGIVVFRDTGHLTATFARTLAKPLAAALQLDQDPRTTVAGRPVQHE